MNEFIFNVQNNIKLLMQCLKEHLSAVIDNIYYTYNVFVFISYIKVVSVSVFRNKHYFVLCKDNELII